MHVPGPGDARRRPRRSWPRCSGCRGRGRGHRLAARPGRPDARLAPTGAAPWSRSGWPGRTPAPTARWRRTWPPWPPSRPGIRGVLVAEAGGASTDAVGNALMNSDFRKAEVTSVPITLILLLAVFGALIAAGIPVAAGRHARSMATISLLAVPGRWLPIGSATSEIVLILGMAVGVDYSLFYLRREREERAAGQVVRRGAADLRRHLRPGDRDLRADRDDLARRVVPHRGRLVHRHGVRHDHRGRHGRGRGRSRCCPRCCRCRRGGGSLPDPVPRPQADRRPAVAAVGRAGAPGRAPPAGVGRRGARWRCWRSPLPRSACGSAARRSTCRTTSRSCTTLNRIPPTFPGRLAPAEIVVTGPRPGRSRRAAVAGRAGAPGVGPGPDPRNRSR